MPTNFLWAAGTNGFIASPFDVVTTELNSLATATLASVSSGFTRTNTGGAMFGQAMFTAGGSFTPSSSLVPYIGCWFIKSHDGGTNYERANTLPARAPDFTFALPQVALSSGDRIFASGPHIELPTDYFKVLAYNYSGVTLPASGNKIAIGPIAPQY